MGIVMCVGVKPFTCIIVYRVDFRGRIQPVLMDEVLATESL
jgi:hypothetical protein